MIQFLLVSLFLTFSPLAHSQLDTAISVTGDYAQSAMTELAASPPLVLLKNEEGKKRSEIVVGYLKLSADDTVNVPSGSQAQEVGDATGFGFSFGHSKSFKDRWSYFAWIQGAVYSGDQTQTTNGIVTTKTDEMDGVIANVSLGISYEFLRDVEMHTLNLYGGPSLMFFNALADVATFNETTGASENNLEIEVSTLIPALTLGLMYEARWFEKWQIAFYTLGVLSLQECVKYDAAVVNQTTGSSFSSPECDASSDISNAEVDIATSFVSLGFKVQYLPWKMGFNISSIIRNLIINEDEDDRAEVEGILISLNKSWGDD